MATPSSKLTDPLVIVLEEHIIAYTKKSLFQGLLQILTKDDKILWNLITTLKMGRPLGNQRFFMKSSEKDLNTKDELLFLDNKLVVPAAVRETFSSMLHESHPGQFGMKLLAEYNSWPNIYREMYHHGKACTQCLEASKYFKICWDQITWAKFPTYH